LHYLLEPVAQPPRIVTAAAKNTAHKNWCGRQQKWA
jgi:hypothetical protein